MGSGTCTKVKILHISDLHFGWRFKKSKWDHLLAAAKAICPDLVIVTGDLVNTPWFWTLARARNHLNLLSEELAVDGNHLEVWTIPGNHDTRITGLLPLAWLVRLALVWAALGAMVLWIASAEGQSDSLIWRGLAVSLFALASAAIILRLMTRMNLQAALGDDHFLSRPRGSSRASMVGILPFDSASTGVSWARGRVIDADFARLGQRIEGVGPGDGRTWIAAVHHHPLPLPYDHKSEAMMAMDNAGAFLSALSKIHVQLVLHGHKHHQHFARITINPAKANAAEVAVLSAGTPTEADHSGRFPHGFNLIHIDAARRIRVDMYESPSGPHAFEMKDSFDIAPLEEQERRRHARDRKELGLFCKRILCIADIDEGGNVHFAREYRGIRAEKARIGELPFPVVAGATNGMVESLKIRRLSSHGPAIRLKEVEPIQWSRRVAKVFFEEAGLSPGDDPIDLLIEFYGNNAIALDHWQSSCMYTEKDVAGDDLLFRVPEGVAVEEFWLHVRFPEYGGLPANISASIKDQSDGVERYISSDRLVRIESQRLIQLRIACPPTQAVVALKWTLGEKNKFDATNQLVPRALALRKKFSDLFGHEIPQALADIFNSLEEAARYALGSGSGTQYDFSVFGFDEYSKRLRCILANYDDRNDARRLATYPFGLGLVGRAFKLKQQVTFDRMKLMQGFPCGYVMADGRGVTDIDKVPENAALAIPMAPQGALQWPYGVLVLSTDDPTCHLRLDDSRQDTSIADFCDTVRSFTDEFEAILLTH